MCSEVEGNCQFMHNLTSISKINDNVAPFERIIYHHLRADCCFSLVVYFIAMIIYHCYYLSR